MPIIEIVLLQRGSAIKDLYKSENIKELKLTRSPFLLAVHRFAFSRQQ